MNEANTQLYEKFTKLQWLLHKHQHRTQGENGPMADPSRGQGRILAILKLQDGISTKDLSYLLGIRVSSLNELLAKMEKGGYISREPSEADRRVILVKLTEKGKNEPQKKVNSDDVFECFSEDEKITLSEYLLPRSPQTWKTKPMSLNANGGCGAHGNAWETKCSGGSPQVPQAASWAALAVGLGTSVIGPIPWNNN